MTKADEVWMALDDFPRFEASSLGRIRATNPSTGEKTVRAQWLGSHGYFMTNTQAANGKRGVGTVHSLVCSAFHGPRPSGADCCHNNGDRHDNRALNLRWDTRAANIADQKAHGTFGFVGKRKLSDIQVLEIIERIDGGDRFVEIARDYKVAHGVVSGINLGNYHSELTGRRRGDAKPKVEKQGRVLCKERVLEIASMLDGGVPQKEIARTYGVTPQNISDINTGKLWGWATGRRVD